MFVRHLLGACLKNKSSNPLNRSFSRGFEDEVFLNDFKGLVILTESSSPRGHRAYKAVFAPDAQLWHDTKSETDAAGAHKCVQVSASPEQLLRSCVARILGHARPRNSSESQPAAVGCSAGRSKFLAECVRCCHPFLGDIAHEFRATSPAAKRTSRLQLISRERRAQLSRPAV